MESDDDNGDPSRPGTVTANATVDARWAPGARVGEGWWGEGVGAEGGAGSSFVVIINVDIDDFPIPLPTIASWSGELDEGRYDARW